MRIDQRHHDGEALVRAADHADLAVRSPARSSPASRSCRRRRSSDRRCCRSAGRAAAASSRSRPPSRTCRARPGTRGCSRSATNTSSPMRQRREHVRAIVALGALARVVRRARQQDRRVASRPSGTTITVCSFTPSRIGIITSRLIVVGLLRRRRELRRDVGRQRRRRRRGGGREQGQRDEGGGNDGTHRRGCYQVASSQPVAHEPQRCQTRDRGGDDELARARLARGPAPVRRARHRDGVHAAVDVRRLDDDRRRLDGDAAGSTVTTGASVHCSRRPSSSSRLICTVGLGSGACCSEPVANRRFLASSARRTDGSTSSVGRISISLRMNPPLTNENRFRDLNA